MVSAELILVSEGCRDPYEGIVILLFIGILYFISTIFLIIRIHQNIKLQRRIEFLEKKLRKQKVYKH